MPLRFAVVGDPVSHSRSPAIHREALRLAGLDGEYVALRVPRFGFDIVAKDLRTGALDGVNVTMPLKGEAFEAAEMLTAEAERSASVNTLRMNDGRLEGHSTDVVAFRQVFGRAPEGAPLLVLGAGGSARAAVAAWSRDGVHVSARAPGRATVVGAAVPWGEGLPGAVVVNATPLGMAGEELPESVLAEASFLVDLPYGSAPTPAVVAARAAGLGHVDGIEFLAIQGAASFRWWTGVAVDLDRLIEVARNA